MLPHCKMRNSVTTLSLNLRGVLLLFPVSPSCNEQGVRCDGAHPARRYKLVATILARKDLRICRVPDFDCGFFRRQGFLDTLEREFTAYKGCPPYTRQGHLPSFNTRTMQQPTVTICSLCMSNHFSISPASYY